MWVDNMVDKSNTSYLYQKRGIYYLSKQVPSDVQHHYCRKRIVVSLRTKSPSLAIRSCTSMLQKLEDYWLSLRLSDKPLPGQHLLQSGYLETSQSDAPLMSEALATYLQLKGFDKDKTFIRGAKRNVKYVIDCLGDRPIDHYLSSDAAMLRDKLLDKGLAVASIKRNFSTIRSIINLSITEQGLDCRNAFARTYMPEERRDVRLPIPIECIRIIQNDCEAMNDDLRWIVALLSDTGMRLGEAVGLAKSDIVIHSEIPHINLTPHPWRRLKTKGSKRTIPLIGASLWAAKQSLYNSPNSNFLFRRYTNQDGCNANSASAAINKWLKPRVPENCVIHSFRHSMRDRLRAVECPSDIIDAIGGWTSGGIGQAYGSGHSLEVKAKWMIKLLPNQRVHRLVAP